jgi:hypothetical protein
MMRYLPAIVMVTLILWSHYCAAQTDNPGPVRVGDRWSYDLKDTATGDIRQSFTLVVFEVNDKEIIARSIIKGAENRPQTAIFNLDWGIIDNGVWQYRPSEIAMNKPLQVGKEWRYEVNAKNQRDGSVWNTSGVAKVVGQEKVTVAAGTFDAFRIEAKGRQLGANDLRSFLTTQVFWYAPAVNRWAKRTFEARSEGRNRDSVSEELTRYWRWP